MNLIIIPPFYFANSPNHKLQNSTVCKQHENACTRIPNSSYVSRECVRVTGLPCHVPMPNFWEMLNDEDMVIIVLTLNIPLSL